MINLEHVVLASPEQMEFVIEGMRNPMNSWEKSDSSHGHYFRREIGEPCNRYKIDDPTEEDLKGERVEYVEGYFELGNNDHSLMQKLSDAGTEHRKYMRMIPVYVRITAPLYWWKEFDTYKVGTVANSCSTMHKIQEKEFTLEDFSTDQLYYVDQEMEDYIKSTEGRNRLACVNPMYLMNEVVGTLNYYRKLWMSCDRVLKANESYGANPEEQRKRIKTAQKKYWWQMIQLLPSSYNQTRNVMLNYEVLANIYRQRKNHKLDEWREFCKWIESLPYSELITSEVKELIPETTGDIRQVFGILKSAGIKLTKEQLEELRKNGVFCYPVADPKKKETEEDTDQTDSFPIIDGEGVKVYDIREYAKEHPEWSEKIRRMAHEDK